MPPGFAAVIEVQYLSAKNSFKEPIIWHKSSHVIKLKIIDIFSAYIYSISHILQTGNFVLNCARSELYNFSLIMCLLVCLFVITLISKITQPGECLIRQAVFRRNEEKYLANHVLQTRQAETELECCMHCVGHAWIMCVSELQNFWKR